MLALLSPAKSLDFETPATTKQFSQSEFLNDSEALIEELRELTPPDIEAMMKISPKLADLNFGRFLNWQLPFDSENAKQAVLAFTGDVYQGLDANSLSAKELKFAQKHLRILSGLYGLLKPLDLIQPYRLEMGTKFANSRGSNLYQFWGDSITEKLNDQLAKEKTPTVINLASNEYFKAVKPKLLNAEVITPVFKDQKNGQYKIISFYAKKARGLMAAYMIKNGITEAKDLKKFNSDGYYFSKELSNDKEWVFLRDHDE
jgi:cytoplasmic iron level regulating protein YaaA (DUF328/UPF0246 family)